MMFAPQIPMPCGAIFIKVQKGTRGYKMNIKQTYKPDTQETLSWDELKIGDVCYHQFTHAVIMKTSMNSYISFQDKKYHTRSKLLQGSKSKVYTQINAKFEFEL